MTKIYSYYTGRARRKRKIEKCRQADRQERTPAYSAHRNPQNMNVVVISNKLLTKLLKATKDIRVHKSQS